MGADAELSFARDVAPLFRDEDVDSMEFAFDLRSYEDVRENAEAIYDRLADGSGPVELALVAAIALPALVAFTRLGDRRAAPARTPR